jgi:hypothetical protein
MGDRRVAYRVLWWRTVDKRPLGRPWHTLEGNIKMDLQDVVCGVMDYINVAKDKDRWWALVNVVMSL